MKDRLSIREKEVLHLILNESSSLEIAGLLTLSVRTVDTHRKNIAKKTNTKSLVGLMKFAIRAELVEDYHYKPGILKRNKLTT